MKAGNRIVLDEEGSFIEDKKTGRQIKMRMENGDFEFDIWVPRPKSKIEEGIKNVCDALELDYHISYPFVFKMNDEFFMMPETREAKRLEIYKAVNFPNKWQLYSKGFEGEGIVDPTLFLDQKKNIWLFVNKAKELYDDYNSELYIYKIDDLKLTTIIPHKLNPVIIDSRRARSAGNIFVEDGKIIRPSQNNIHSIYGYGLNLSEIKELSLENYKEEPIKILGILKVRNLIL